MKTQYHNFLYHLYPVVITILAVLLLLWLFWPNFVEAKTTIINNNSSTITNNISTKSSSSGGQNRVKAEIYTEVDGEVVHDEVYEESGSEAAEVRVEQRVVSDGEESEVETDVHVSGSRFQVSGNQDISDIEMQNGEIKMQNGIQTEKMTDFTETVGKDSSGETEVVTDEAECEDDVQVGVCDVSGGAVGDTKTVSVNPDEDKPLQLSWWQAFWLNLGNWWQGVWSMFA